VDGPGGALTLTPIRVTHGNIDALGFRIGDLCYLPDVSDIPDAAWPEMAGLKLWVVDALRYTPHPTHAHLERTLGWIARARPAQAIITNMHIDLDYARLLADLPPGVIPAYDGLTWDIPL
jgi:phosphoribosyl 1,2-cyclic phosphate phosphodiesterase